VQHIRTAISVAWRAAGSRCSTRWTSGAITGAPFLSPRRDSCGALRELSNSQGSGPSGATHAATAIRCGCDAFLSRERRLLNKANPARAGFNGFLILDAEAAAEVDRRRISAALRRSQPDSGALSDPRILADRECPPRCSLVLRESR
jgi:hypothetical protein